MAQIDTVYAIYPPGLHGIGVTLGRRNGEWYLVYCRAYGMAESRVVSRLSVLGVQHKSILGNGHHCFWLDNTDASPSGGKPWNHTLLDHLLEPRDPGDPPVVAVKGIKSLSKGKSLILVEVLLQDGQISHCCESCGGWEYVDDKRWKQIPGSDAYLCTGCYQQDWFGSQALRLVRRTLGIGLHSW